MTLVYLAVAWLAGIVLAGAVNLPWPVLLVLGLAAFVSLLLWRGNASVRLGAVCALAMALGAGRFLIAVPHFDETSLATYNIAGWVTIEGIVTGEPDERERWTNLRVQAERLELPDGTVLAVKGLALVAARGFSRYEYGDRVQVEGLLKTPPVLETFSYRDYLARQGIYSWIDRAQVTVLARNQGNPFLHYLYAFKRYARSTIASLLPEPQAALLTGILLGIDTGIPRDLMDDFSATGTTHIIAISGFNLTIIASILAGLARRLFGRRRAFWVAAAGVALYTVLVGASAAVVRAALMGGLYLWAQYLGRESSAPVSLGAAAIVMTAWNPNTLWDVGFQLSFAATLGLMLYTEPLERSFERVLGRLASAERAERIVGSISETLVTTLAAQITTLPVLLFHFGQLSVVTLLSNSLILPVQPLLMVSGGIATLLGLVFRPLGQVAGWVAWVFLAFTIEMVRLTARIPLASVAVQMDAWMVFAYYALLGGMTWWLGQPRKRRGQLWDELRSGSGGVTPALLSRVETKGLVGAAAILLVLAFFAWRSLPDGRLHIVFLDVGQGDAVLIETPSGRQVLVDGGPSGAVLLSELGRQMPFWDRTLDVMVLTHPEFDHITGLVAVLERYKIAHIVFREMEMDSVAYTRWLELVAQEGAEVYQGETGLQMTLDGADALRLLKMLVLHPESELVGGREGSANNNSIVLRIDYGQVSVLLPGDIEAAVERRLVEDGASLRSTVLKAAHHGSCTSTSEPFLNAVDPDVIIISVGENDYGHPCDDVVARLEGVALYRTDEHGTVEIVTDGVRVWARTERERH